MAQLLAQHMRCTARASVSCAPASATLSTAWRALHTSARRCRAVAEADALSNPTRLTHYNDAVWKVDDRVHGFTVQEVTPVPEFEMQGLRMAVH